MGSITFFLPENTVKNSLAIFGKVEYNILNKDRLN